MISPYWLLRLAWRPLTYLGAMLVVALGSLPFLIATDEFLAPLAYLWRGTASEGVRIALWHALAFVPPAAGHVLGTYRLEVQHTLFSWPLPRVHTRLAVGTTFVMAVVAAAMAALLARNEPAAAAAAGFALACYAFLLPGYVFDVTGQRWSRLLLLFPYAIMIGWPATTAELTRTYPVLVIAALLPLGALQVLAIASVERARLRPFRRSRYLPTTAPAAVSTARDAARRWRGSLAAPRIAPWLRAAAYETGVRFPVTHLAYAAAAVLATRVIDGPFLVAIVASGLLMDHGHLLGMRVPYPLSRGMRAKLAYIGTLLDTAVFCACGVLLLAISWELPLPRLPLGYLLPPAQTTDFLAAWGATFALAPIAQWGRIRWPATPPSEHRASMRVAPGLLKLAFVSSAMVMGMMVATRSDGDVQRALVVLGGITVVVQLLHALGLHLHYTRSDLVPLHT